MQKNQHDFQQLTHQLTAAALAHFSSWKEQYPDETIYCYAFFTPPCVEWAGMVALTEESLERVALQYVQDGDYEENEIEDAKEDLRWSAADSPHCNSLIDSFEEVNQTLAEISQTTHQLGAESQEFEDRISNLYNSLIEALKAIREDIFENQPNPLLTVWFGDQSDDEALFFMENCNTAETLSEFKRYIENEA